MYNLLKYSCQIFLTLNITMRGEKMKASKETIAS